MSKKERYSFICAQRVGGGEAENFRRRESGLPVLLKWKGEGSALVGERGEISAG